MSLPKVLRRLDRLDRSSYKFPDELTSLINGQKYKSLIGRLKKDQVVGLVDYLDNVCPALRFACSPLILRRFLILLMPLALRIGNAYINLEAYAAPGNYCRSRTHSKVLFLLTPAVISTKNRWETQGFGSTD